MNQPADDAATGTLAELYRLADEVEAALNDLLDHSEIYHDDINARGSGVTFVGWNPRRWKDLAGPGQAALGKARQTYAAWVEHTAKAIAVAAPERQKRFDKDRRLLDAVLRLSERVSSGAPAARIDAVREKVAESLARQCNLLAELPTAHGAGGRFLVPDTNALLYQPNIEEWTTAGGPVTFVIVSQVVRELDEKKLGERPVAEAANTVIRKLKEFGRRGDTFAGVSLRPGAWLREDAVDADMDDSLSWLRAGHADDELLAAVLALKWRNLNAEIEVVTRDRNLQNKARMARVQYIDVDTIAKPRARPQPKQPTGTDATADGRSRLQGALRYATDQLGVPPAGTATRATEQSWSVLVTPLSVPIGFAQRVLGPDGHPWFTQRVDELFEEPVPISRPPSAPEMAARGFTIRRRSILPQKGSLRLVADAGGLVGVRYDLEIDPPDRRVLLLQAIEDEYLRPLARTCLDALEHLNAHGPALIDLWAIGLSKFAILTAGHQTLRQERDGLMQKSVHHVGRDISVPTRAEDLDRLIASWGRELARAAGIAAWEPGEISAPPQSSPA